MDEQNTLFGAFDDIIQDDAQEHPESDTGHPEEQDELVQIGLYIASLLEEISGDLSCLAGEGSPVPASRTGENSEARDGNLLRPTPPPVPSASSGWSSRSPVRGATPHNNEPSVIREATPPVSLPANSESPTAIPANVAPAPVPAMPARPEDEDTPAHVESETASERQLERVEAESDVQRQEQQDNSLLGQLKRNLAQWDGQPVNDDANLTEAAGMAVDGPLFAAVKDIARLVETDKNDTSLLGVLKKTIADKTGITAAQDWAEAQRASMIEGIRAWANGGTPESTGDSSPEPEASTYSQRDEQGRFIRRDAPAPAPVASEPPSQTLPAPVPAEPPSPASASVHEPTPVPTASEPPSQSLPALASVLVPTASEPPSQALPTPAAQDDANPVFSLQRNDSKRQKKRHAEVVRHLRNITDILESFPTASRAGTTVDGSQGNASALAPQPMQPVTAAVTESLQAPSAQTSTEQQATPENQRTTPHSQPQTSDEDKALLELFQTFMASRRKEERKLEDRHREILRAINAAGDGGGLLEDAGNLADIFGGGGENSGRRGRGRGGEGGRAGRPGLLRRVGGGLLNAGRSVGGGLLGFGGSLLGAGAGLGRTAMSAMPEVAAMAGRGLSSIGSGVASAGRGAAGLLGGVGLAGAKAIPVIGQVLAAGMAVHDGVQGWNDTEAQRTAFGLREDQEVTTGQKASMATASILDMGGLFSGAASLLGFDIDTGDIAGALYGAAEGLGNAGSAVGAMLGMSNRPENAKKPDTPKALQPPATVSASAAQSTAPAVFAATSAVSAASQISTPLLHASSLSEAPSSVSSGPKGVLRVEAATVTLDIDKPMSGMGKPPVRAGVSSLPLTASLETPEEGLLGSLDVLTVALNTLTATLKENSEAIGASDPGFLAKAGEWVSGLFSGGTSPQASYGGVPAYSSSGGSSGSPSVSSSGASASGKAQAAQAAQAIPAGGMGALSAKYESARAGSKAVGFDRVGGTSYGKYQIATRTGTMDNFLSFIKDKNPEAHQRLMAAGPADSGKQGAFAQEWRKIAAEGKFGDLEHEFIKATHFDPAFKGIKSENARKMISDSKTMQDVLWSTSVHHGPSGAPKLINAAYREGMSEEEFMKALYARRANNFGSSTAEVQASARNRMVWEEKDAQAMLAREKAEKSAAIPATQNTPQDATGNPITADAQGTTATTVAVSSPPAGATTVAVSSPGVPASPVTQQEATPAPTPPATLPPPATPATAIPAQPAPVAASFASPSSPSSPVPTTATVAAVTPASFAQPNVTPVSAVISPALATAVTQIPPLGDIPSRPGIMATPPARREPEIIKNPMVQPQQAPFDTSMIENLLSSLVEAVKSQKSDGDKKDRMDAIPTIRMEYSDNYSIQLAHDRA